MTFAFLLRSFRSEHLFLRLTLKPYRLLSCGCFLGKGFLIQVDSFETFRVLYFMSFALWPCLGCLLRFFWPYDVLVCVFESSSATTNFNAEIRVVLPCLVPRSRQQTFFVLCVRRLRTLKAGVRRVVARSFSPWPRYRFFIFSLSAFHRYRFEISISFCLNLSQSLFSSFSFWPPVPFRHVCISLFCLRRFAFNLGANFFLVGLAVHWPTDTIYTLIFVLFCRFYSFTPNIGCFRLALAPFLFARC